MKKVELLAPAGNMERLKTAFLYGTDACYIGGVEYSLRANAKNFNIDEINDACIYAHKRNKKIYVTVNIVFHNNNIDGLIDYLKKLEEAGVDAIIISDPFIIDIVKENNIKLNIHISTQYSLSNYKACEYFKDEGVERVVLARELSKNNIKEIIDKTNMETEVFIHGAMCSSSSGRCTLSNYFTNRDANRGGCAQVCRWEFDLYDKDNNLISEKTKFTLSTKDLSMIDYIKDMIDIGITSFKIEGRMRSDYYVATVIDTYRRVIDDYYNNSLTSVKLDYYKRVLQKVANRDNIDQFFNMKATVREQYYLGRVEESNQDFLGLILDYNKETKEVTLEQRNYFKPSDEVEVFGPSHEIYSFKVPTIYDIDGNKLDVARHPKQIIKFKLDYNLDRFDIMRKKI